MKETFKHIFQDKIILWSVCLSLLLLVALILYIIIYYPQLPPILPLYNRMPWGYSRLGSKPEFFVPLGISLAFIFINFFAISKMYNKNVFVSRIIGVVSFT